MKHLQSYSLYESINFDGSLLDVCDSLLGSTEFWNRNRSLIDPSITLEIDTESPRSADAHFARDRSTPNKVVIEMSGYPQTLEEKGTLAHELTHAVQWITGREGDLMFITDITSYLEGYSLTDTWERLLFAIYLSCPQEEEAWKMGNRYHRESVLEEILPWMRDFDPQRTSKELLANPPEENPWEITSFSELPVAWAEAYENYGEIQPDSQIPQMGNLTLEQFLEHYGRAFKATAKALR